MGFYRGGNSIDLSPLMEEKSRLVASRYLSRNKSFSLYIYIYIIITVTRDSIFQIVTMLVARGVNKLHFASSSFARSKF